MSDLKLTGISKSFGKTQVLRGVDLTIRSGEFVSLLGASGCGKTTLLRIVAGLETVSAGSVEIDGADVTDLPPEKRDIAMMFQSYALLPHMSVTENVRFPLRMRRQGTRDEQYARVAAALETVQLSQLAERMPRQLSGGQQQRVALARAIVSNPKVLLLDEPLSNLDARLREEMQVELIDIHRRIGLTTLFVTHDQEEALSLSDRVVLMNRGAIEQEATPRQIYDAPATAYASSFLGSANLVPATISGGVARLADGQTLPMPAGSADGAATLVLRQENVDIAEDGELSARVVTRVYLGSRNRYILDLAGQKISVLAPAAVMIEPGATVRLRVAPERVRVLPG
jgi:ABC-type Fe3+/spermidine/putrescine transport system ATPase subunit